jgi:hypothetical protein
VCEMKLAEEQARGLHSFDKWDLSVKLEELHPRVARVEDEHATEARKLSTLGCYPYEIFPNSLRRLRRSYSG